MIRKYNILHIPIILGTEAYRRGLEVSQAPFQVRRKMGCIISSEYICIYVCVCVAERWLKRSRLNSCTAHTQNSQSL